MKWLALPLLLTVTALALAGCAGTGQRSFLLPPASFKAAQGMLTGAPHKFALQGYGLGVGLTQANPIPTLEVSRLPDSTPVTVTRQWAKNIARGRKDGPWFDVSATLVRATAKTESGTGRIFSNRIAWLVLMPADEQLVSGKPGSYDFDFTKVVLIDANTGQFLEGVELPSSAWR